MAILGRKTSMHYFTPTHTLSAHNSNSEQGHRRPRLYSQDPAIQILFPDVADRLMSVSTDMLHA